MTASRTACGLCNNLGRKKIEQQTPPEIKDEAVQKPKRAILWEVMAGGGGEGGSKISICFVQGCSSTDDV